MKTLLADIGLASRHAWRGFRGRSKYFQYKAWIGIAYIALLLLTVIIVVPRTPSNRLQAYVLAAHGDFVVGSYIMVRNDSAKDWEKLKLTLNGVSAFAVGKLKAGDKVTVTLPKFQPPIAAADVRELKIECDRGQEVYAVRYPGRAERAPKNEDPGPGKK